MLFCVHYLSSLLFWSEVRIHISTKQPKNTHGVCVFFSGSLSLSADQNALGGIPGRPLFSHSPKAPWLFFSVARFSHRALGPLRAPTPLHVRYLFSRRYGQKPRGEDKNVTAKPMTP